jgi:hypothetical protein
MWVILVMTAWAHLCHFYLSHRGKMVALCNPQGKEVANYSHDKPH